MGGQGERGVDQVREVESVRGGECEGWRVRGMDSARMMCEG